MKRLLKSILYDLIFIGIILIGQRFENIQWFSTFVISFICILSFIVSLFILFSEDIKEDFFKQLDIMKETFLYRVYQNASNIFILGILVYFQYKIASITYFMCLILMYAVRSKYKEEKKEK